MSETINVLVFVGSRGKGSYNKALVYAAVEMAPQYVPIEVFGLVGIPPFNQEFEANPPPKVKEFKEKIRAANTLLISTPEYNYSITDVLKNVIDCAQRPKADSPWKVNQSQS